MTFDPDLIDFRVPDMPFWVQFEALVLFTPAGMEISLLNLSKSPLLGAILAYFGTVLIEILAILDHFTVVGGQFPIKMTLFSHF